MRRIANPKVLTRAYAGSSPVWSSNSVYACGGYAALRSVRSADASTSLLKVVRTPSRVETRKLSYSSTHGGLIIVGVVLGNGLRSGKSLSN